MYFTAHDNECPAHIPKHYEKVLNLPQLFHKPTIPTYGKSLSTDFRNLKSAFSSSNEPMSFVIVQEIVGYDKQIVTAGIRRTVVGTKPDLKTCSVFILKDDHTAVFIPVYCQG